MSRKDELIRSLEGGYASPEDFGLEPCEGCGHIPSDAPSPADAAHDNLCCGRPESGPCGFVQHSFVFGISVGEACVLHTHGREALPTP